METIGERIKYARRKKGLTQTEIKESTGISSGNLSDIENNKSLPSAQALISLKRELDVSIDWLLTGEEPIKKEAPVKVGKLKPLSQEEKEIIWKYQQLDTRDREYVMDNLDMLYKKQFDKRGTLSNSLQEGESSEEEAAASETA